MLTLRVVFSGLGEIAGTIAIVLIGVFVLEVILYFILKRSLNWKHALPIMLLTPGLVGLLALIAWPIIYQVYIAFTDWTLATLLQIPNPGFGVLFDHLGRIFTGEISQGLTFGDLFLRTIQFTVTQVFFHVSFGLVIAMLLNRPMKLRGVYRTILLTPWAIPQVIAVLVMRSEFSRYGFPNIMLTRIGFQHIEWMSNGGWNWFAINATNIWLGIPFMMVILLGGLQSIDHTYYEAAEMDGAGGFTKFRHITLPLLQPVMTPAVILGFIWTFNLFNIPFFINQRNLASSEILVTALFKAFAVRGEYGFAAAFAFVIFFILLVFSILYMKITKFEAMRGSSPNMARSKAVGE